MGICSASLFTGHSREMGATLKVLPLETCFTCRSHLLKDPQPPKPQVGNKPSKHQPVQGIADPDGNRDGLCSRSHCGEWGGQMLLCTGARRNHPSLKARGLVEGPGSRQGPLELNMPFSLGMTGGGAP